MRTAILSTLASTDDGTRRAALNMGGRSILAWQIDVALALGSTRILVLADRPQTIPDLHAQRGRCEGEGVELQVAGGAGELIGKVSADQEIIVMADGIVMERALAEELLAGGRGVTALPCEPALSAGFERLDAKRAWAGLFAARGRIVEQLSGLPDDFDVPSTLLRLALQSGAPVIDVDPARLKDGSILLAIDASVLDQRETALLSSADSERDWFAPGIAMADTIARKTSPGSLARGPAFGALGSVALVAGALGATGYGWHAAGLGLLAASALGLTVANTWRRLKARLTGTRQNVLLARGSNALLDIALVTILVLATITGDLVRAAFLPLIFVGLFRLTQALAEGRARHIWSDRALLAAVLGLAAGTDILVEMLQVFSLFALAASLYFRRRARLTRA